VLLAAWRIPSEFRKIQRTNEALMRGADSMGTVDAISRRRNGFDLYYHYFIAGSLYPGRDWCHYGRSPMPKVGDAIALKVHPRSPQFSLSIYSVYYGPGRYGLLSVAVVLLVGSIVIATVFLRPSWWLEKLNSLAHRVGRRPQAKIKNEPLKKAIAKVEELGGGVLGWGPDIFVHYEDQTIKERLIKELGKEGWVSHEKEDDLQAYTLTFTKTA
jgi:hypothetical protein